MYEVEAKVVLLAPGALRDRLRHLGAALHGSALEEDLFFAHPDRDFARTDEALRLRRRPDGMTLTYKGPRQPGDAKVREECDVPVGADPTALLARIGMKPVLRLRKKRETWRLGDVTVTIDDVDGLGTFAEVEVVAADPDAAAAAVEEAVQGLGLGGADRVATSYLELAVQSGAAAVEDA